MSDLPAGTVTFLFTDIAGSTRLLQQLGADRYAELLADQRAILRAAFGQHNGREIDTQGDSFFVSFPRATEAIAAAVAIQYALATHDWPEGVEVRVRMGLHTGEPLVAEEGYVGMDVHRAARIAHVGHGGQVLLSDTTTTLVQRDLPERVGLKRLGSYHLKDLGHPEQITQLTIPGVPSSFPPLKARSPSQTNLPAPLTSFVGRDKQVQELNSTLSDPDCRLLTLVGPGGIGKTRLAIQVLSQRLDQHPDGIWFVDLAAVDRSDSVLLAVAGAIGVHVQAGQNLTDTIIFALQNRPLLLVMDNCEHVLEAISSFLAPTLERCPDLIVVATSREALRIPGERLYPVPVMELPDAESTIEDLAVVESVDLFLQRGRAIQPGFGLSPENSSAIFSLCRNLDGMPLALELAAARLRSLPLRDIVNKLDRRFGLLTGGVRSAHQRQQTLIATVEWSYELLSEQEKSLFNRLTVFHGGWTLEAAERVCSEEGIKARAVLVLLSSLVEKSLVMVDDRGGVEARYRMLDTLRHFGWDRLRELGDTEIYRRRHAQYYAELAERYPQDSIAGEDEINKNNIMDADEDNLLAAVYWSVEQQDGIVALRILGPNINWFAKSHLTSESYDLIKQALDIAREAPDKIRWAGLFSLSILILRDGGDLAFARDLISEQLAIAYAAEEPGPIAWSLRNQGWAEEAAGNRKAALSLYRRAVEAARNSDNQFYLISILPNQGIMEPPDLAEELLEEALRLAKARGNINGQAWVHLFRADFYLFQMVDLNKAAESAQESFHYYNLLGDIGRMAALVRLFWAAILQGKYEKAMDIEAQNQAIAQRVGIHSWLVGTSIRQGMVAHHRGDIAEAEKYYDIGLKLIEQAQGDDWGTARIYLRLGILARDRQAYDEAEDYCQRSQKAHKGFEGVAKAALASIAARRRDPGKAIEYYQECLAYFKEIHENLDILVGLEGLGQALAFSGDSIRAAWLLGFSSLMRKQTGLVIPHPEQSFHDHAVKTVRQNLGAALFERRWKDGEDLTIEGALALGLSAVKAGE